TIDMNDVTLEQLKQYFSSAHDIKLIKKYYSPPNMGLQAVKYEVIYIFSQTMIDHITFKESVLPGVKTVFEETGFFSLERIEYNGELDWRLVGSAEEPITVSQLIELLFEGSVLCFFPHLKGCLSISVSGYPIRDPS